MINKEEVKHVAKLARLGLTPREIEKMQKDLSLVLDYFSLLKNIDVSKVEPTSHSISKLGSSFREDKEAKRSPEEIKKLIEVAPEKEGRYIRVKEIL